MKRIRGFEKISFEQFKTDFISEPVVNILYEQLKYPQRSTATSAGYDFFALKSIELKPNQEIIVATGMKAYMQQDEWLAILVRSGHGFKYNLRLMNQTGVIDADYYNNPGNEGHIFVALKNEGTKVWRVAAGQAFAQGIFMKYLCVDEDLPVQEERLGGIGSSDRRD